MSKDDGGPAFPNESYSRYEGMTLRDYMAIHASEEDVQSILGYSRMVSRRQARYMHADAMLADRAK